MPRRKLPGTIERRGPDAFRVGFQVKDQDGAWRWIRVTIHVDAALSESRQRKEAELALAKLHAEHAADGIRPDRQRHTLATLADLWLREHVEPTMAPSTVSTYRSLLRAHILPDLGEIPVRQLTPLAITSWLNRLRTSPRIRTLLPDDQLATRRRPSDQAKLTTEARRSAPLSERTVQHCYDTLANILAFGVSVEILRRSPMAKVERPHPRRPRVGTLTEEQARRLLDELAESDNSGLILAVHLALLCGLRLSEVDGLRLSDVDWSRETIDISRTVRMDSTIGPTKTAAGERLIAVPQPVMRLLRAAAEEHERMRELVGSLWCPDGWIVHGWDGRRVHHDTPSKWFRTFADTHGFPGVTFHQLRHTHASILLANSIDAVSVAYRMGHSDPSTTLRTYAHALRRRDTDAADTLDAVFLHPDTSPQDPPPSPAPSIQPDPSPNSPISPPTDPTPDPNL